MSSSSTETPSQMSPVISDPPSANRGNGESGDAQTGETGGGGNLDCKVPISAKTCRITKEPHSANVVQQGEVPPMSLLQGSSNFNINNSNFNQIYGNATIIRFGDGQFTEDQRNLICDFIVNHANLPDFNQNKPFLIQSIVNLPRAEAIFDDYQTKKKSGPCFEGTRVVLLREMAEWATGSDESRMYVLSGLAGIGKSTVAYTIASRAANLNLLGASFFFSRDESDRKNAKKFFTTIAYQLCLYDETFAKAIGDALQADGGYVATKGPQEQLQALIVDPLHSIVQSRARPILLVIDALDECDEEDALSVLTGLKQLLQALPSFKVILTTRPQPRLDRFFGRHDGHKIFHLQDIENKVVDSDIRLYLNHELSLENVQERLPTSRWYASNKEIEALVSAAGRLFIIASTLVRIVLDKVAFDPVTQMQQLLDTFAQDRTPFKDLNEFYTVILRNVVPADCNVNIVNRYQSVIGAILFVQQPLPITALADLIKVDVEGIRAVLVNLRSVILLGDDDIPRIYHKSFPDYITDSKLCQDIKLRIDPTMRHMQITICCFQIMDKHLKRNILSLGVPARFMTNKDGVEVDGITNKQIEEKIPQHLRYACVYWDDHLKVANTEDEAIMNGLEMFVNKHMLYWLEVLSLIGKLDSAYHAISAVLRLLTSTSSDLHQLLSDALRFISKFYDIIERSALHTYYSALPFTPIDSLLHHRYIKEAEHNVCSIEGGPEKWDPFVAALGHADPHFIRISLDSTLLVSCSEDRVNYGTANSRVKLKIWDAATGTPIATIPGYRFAVANDLSAIASSQDNIVTVYNVNGSPSGPVFTMSSKIEELALSSESSRVAAALSDGTVWLWDSENVGLIDRFDGFQGHWLKFSRTGTRLAYSSTDYINLRDGINGRFIANLRCGSGFNFEFSGDGSRIASASKDDLILWNSESGELIATVMVRNIAWRLAISSNGSLLATADDDKVTLWSDSLAKLKVLQADRPYSMAFSLNNILAIAAKDEVKLYNVNTHCFIYTLPSSASTIIAFSPDCTRLAVGTYRDVKLWDIRSLDAAGPPPERKSTHVDALALSRDCSRLVRGFLDGTVELWDTSPTMRQIDIRSQMNFFFRIFCQSRHTSSVWALAFDPHGKLFASGSHDGTIKLWNGRDGVLRGTFQAFGPVYAVALSNSVLVASWDGGVTLWSLDMLRPIHTFEMSDIGGCKVSISEDSTLIALSFYDRGNRFFDRVALFDAVNCTTIRTFDVHSKVHTMSFLLDNSQLVVQLNKGIFRSFDLINNHITEGPILEHLVQLPSTPLWHGAPVRHCQDKEQHYLAALFSQHKNLVPVLWIPKQIRVTEWTQGSSMIALSCEDGRIILLRLSTSHVS